MYIFLAFVTAIKILLSPSLQLSNDEVYYITYARNLRLNYFDHPPMVGVVLKIFSLNLLLKNEFFLRLGFIFLGSIILWLAVKIGEQLYNQTAPWFTILLFSASIYTGIISGFMIMPDSPMLALWLWAFYLALKIIKDDGKEKAMYLLLFGIASGLAMMSKVSSVMLWAGLGFYIVFFQRALLREISLYFSALFTVLISFPVTILGFVQGSGGAAYHASRIAISSLGSLRFDFFLQQILGEIAYINPVCYVLIVIGIVYVIKNNILPKKQVRLIFCFALPLICLVWFSSLYNKTLPHWTGPSFAVLMFFPSVMLAHRIQTGKRKLTTLYIANGLLALLLVTIIISVRYLPVSFNKSEPKLLGKGDLLLDFSGWKGFGSYFNSVYQSDIKNRLMKPNAFIISNYWFPSAHLDWYVAEPNKIPFTAIGKINDIHEYARLNRVRKQLQPGDDAYFITISNYYNEPSKELIESFSSLGRPETAVQYRNGVAVRKFYIMRLKSYNGVLKVNQSH